MSLTIENTDDSSRVAYVYPSGDEYHVRVLTDSIRVSEITAFDSFQKAVGEAAHLVSDDRVDTGQLVLTYS